MHGLKSQGDAACKSRKPEYIYYKKRGFDYEGETDEISAKKVHFQQGINCGHDGEV